MKKKKGGRVGDSGLGLRRNRTHFNSTIIELDCRYKQQSKSNQRYEINEYFQNLLGSKYKKGITQTPVSRNSKP